MVGEIEDRLLAIFDEHKPVHNLLRIINHNEFGDQQVREYFREFLLELMETIEFITEGLKTNE